MSEAVPPLSQYAFMAWFLVKKVTGTTLAFTYRIILFELRFHVKIQSDKLGTRKNPKVGFMFLLVCYG
jgi:hypothetical protein